MKAFSAHDLTVVIPTRDRWDILRRTIDALAAQTVKGFEVIVVVDGTDQRVEDLPGARVIVKEHGGPGAARNAGVRESTRPLILFLDSDMIPVPRFIERHLARHSASPEQEVAVLGHVDWHHDLGRSPILSWLDWSSTQFDHRGIAGDEAGWGRFYSCNVSLKRDFFLLADGFDEDFVYYYDDTDMGWRLNEKGMRLLYERGARTFHHQRFDLESVIRRFERIAVGERMMTAKHPWFKPFFRERVEGALARPPASWAWTRIVDLIPRSAGRLRRRAERRANEHYYQRVGPRFLNSWEGARDLEELKEYLGAEYDERLLRASAAAVDREEKEIGDEKAFYGSSRMYLYDLTAFAMSGTKVPYHVDLRRIVPPGGRLLDWGCGIGSDGLRLIDAGYRVAFADFDNPSTRFLRWRLDRRGIDAPVYDITKDEIPGDFDAAYAFDVIEHVDDPFAFLAQMERHARIVVVNLLEATPDDPHLHRPLPIPALLAHAQRRGLMRYRRYHGRSHFIVFRSNGATSPAKLRGRAERVLGSLLAGRR